MMASRCTLATMEAAATAGTTAPPPPPMARRRSGRRRRPCRTTGGGSGRPSRRWFSGSRGARSGAPPPHRLLPPGPMARESKAGSSRVPRHLGIVPAESAARAGGSATVPEIMAEVIWTDVGPRDGLQNLADAAPTEVNVRLGRGLLATAVPPVEATSFVSPKWVPQLADAAEVLNALDRSDLARLRVPI